MSAKVSTTVTSEEVAAEDMLDLEPPLQAAPKSAAFDAEMINRAVSLLFEPGQVVELRALEVPKSKHFTAPVVYGYFDDRNALVRAACELSEQGAAGVFVTLNPVNPALLARAANRVKQAGKGDCTEDANILCQRWLFIDLDAKRLKGISATDPEHDAAIAKSFKIREYLRCKGWTKSILADSGNGAHLLYPIDLPRNDDDTVKRILKALAKRFDDDVVEVDQKVFNAGRLVKLYGTIVRKGDHTADRPHRLARIIEVEEEG